LVKIKAFFSEWITWEEKEFKLIEPLF
jgi:hypothetical protein